MIAPLTNESPKLGVGFPQGEKDSGLAWPVRLYLIAVVLPVSFNIGPLLITSVRAVLLVMTIPLLIKLLSGKIGRILITDVMFLMYIAWGVLALSITSASQVISQSGSVGVEFIGGYLISRAYIRDRESFLAMCRFLVILVLISTPFAIYEAKTGHPAVLEFIRKIPGVTSVLIVTNQGRLGLERVQYTFAHPIHYGLFCSVTLALCFVALKNVYSNGRRWAESLIIMLSGFLALSSGALLAIALQVALISWFSIFSRVRARWWILFGLFGLAYFVIDILSSRSPLEVFMSYATFSAHNAYWRSIIFEWGVKNLLGDASLNIPAAPWFGLGMNTWIRPYYMYSGSMDNFWLVTAIRFGIPGLAFLLIGYTWGIFKVMRRDFDNIPALLQIRRAWVFTFLGLSFTLCTVFVWSNIFSFVFFMFGAGIWLITTDGITSEQPDTAVTPKEDTNPKLVYTRFPRQNSQSSKLSSLK
jgi:hypothetical protein